MSWHHHCACAKTTCTRLALSNGWAQAGAYVVRLVLGTWPPGFRASWAAWPLGAGAGAGARVDGAARLVAGAGAAKVDACSQHKTHTPTSLLPFNLARRGKVTKHC